MCIVLFALHFVHCSCCIEICTLHFVHWTFCMFWMVLLSPGRRPTVNTVQVDHKHGPKNRLCMLLQMQCVTQVFLSLKQQSIKTSFFKGVCEQEYTADRHWRWCWCIVLPAPVGSCEPSEIGFSLVHCTMHIVPLALHLVHCTLFIEISAFHCLNWTFGMFWMVLLSPEERSTVITVKVDRIHNPKNRLCMLLQVQCVTQFFATKTTIKKDFFQRSVGTRIQSWQTLKVMLMHYFASTSWIMWAKWYWFFSGALHYARCAFCIAPCVLHFVY